MISDLRDLLTLSYLLEKALLERKEALDAVMQVWGCYQVKT